MIRHFSTFSESIARFVVTSLLVLPAASQAQTLGDELILSRLGDPIEVEIMVENWQDFDLSRMTVGNGNAEQYELFGLEYQPILDDLNFALVGPNLAGEVKVLISSREPISEPFLELLLVLSWPAGSTVRDYVLLFDPPVVAPTVSNITNQSQQQVVVTTTEAPRQVAPQAPVAEPMNAAEPPPSNQPDVRTQVAINVDDVADDASNVPIPTADALNVERRRYAVRNNDTLWVIARQFQPAGDTENLYQFLISLHDLNRDAFINGNISLLRSGADLLIPTARDVSSINPATAQTVFEGRWADGTRVATGMASAPPPEFAVLNESVEEAPAPEVAAPPRPPGSELPVVQQNSGLSTTASNEVIAVGAETNMAAADAAVVDQEVPLENPAANVSQSPLTPSDNPYLQQVVDSAQKIQQLLETRQQRLVQVEEQLLAMRVQMQEARIAALELNAKLQQAATLRERQRSSNQRNVAFLGTLVAGLLLALGLALKKTVVLHRQIGELIRFRREVRERKQGGVTPAVVSVSMDRSQPEVVEIEEITMDAMVSPERASDEIERDRDKVPDIDMSAKDVLDFLVAEPIPAVEDSGGDPRSTV